MLALQDIPLFRGLNEEARARVSQVATIRKVRAGNLVLRKGDHGRELLVIASGGVSVRAVANAAPVLLGPGEVLGEMSLITGQPVSATVTAAKDTELWVVSAHDFQGLIEAHPVVAAELLKGLSRRLRGREREASAAGALAPQVVVVDDTSLPDRFADALRTAVARRAPSVEISRASSARSGSSVIEQWRASANRDAILIVVLPGTELAALSPVLEASDAVLGTPAGSTSNATASSTSSLADHAQLRLKTDEPPAQDASWAFTIDDAEIARATSATAADAARTPTLDRVARWIARQEVGLALGAGGARGFAHLGVLAELESLGLPIDRLAGTSMGGISALLFGLGGTGTAAIELAAQKLGPGPGRWSWVPLSALLSPRELRQQFASIAGNRTFAELAVPVAVVASDLVRGERVVIDRGPVMFGFLATSALPGIVPPVFDGDRVLVDGGLLMRLPLELLPRSRCALRIAVNVSLPPNDMVDAAAEARELRRVFSRALGFRDVLARSYRLLGWTHGTRDAADADLLIEPRTSEYSGNDYRASWRGLVEAGRAAVREQSAEILAATADVRLMSASL